MIPRARYLPLSLYKHDDATDPEPALTAQHLAKPSLPPVSMVAAFWAIQAQEYGQAKWAVGLRTPGETEADIERLLARRADSAQPPDGRITSSPAVADGPDGSADDRAECPPQSRAR